MKNSLKKAASIVLLVTLLFSFLKITNAFEYMDVCNYTNGDHSGNYYDGICTKDGKLEEGMKKRIENQNKSEYTYKKSEKKHALNEVKHNTGSSFLAIHSNSNRDITLLKKELKEKNELIQKYINENNELLKKQDYLLKVIKEKNILLNKAKKQNDLLKYYIQKNVELKEKIIESYKKDKKIIPTSNTNYDAKTAAEIIREKIKRRNALLK